MTAEEKVLIAQRIEAEVKGVPENYLLRLIQNPPQDEEGRITCASDFIPDKDLNLYKNRVENGDLFMELMTVFPDVPFDLQRKLDRKYLSLVYLTEQRPVKIQTPSKVLVGIQRIPFIREAKVYVPGVYKGKFDVEVIKANFPLEEAAKVIQDWTIKEGQKAPFAI